MLREATKSVSSAERTRNAPPIDPGIGDGNGKGQAPSVWNSPSAPRDHPHPSPALEVAPMIFKPPYTRGLVLIRHRLAAPLAARNLVRISVVHQATARLPQVIALKNQSGSEQAETPEATTPGASSTASVRALSWSRTE